MAEGDWDASMEDGGGEFDEYAYSAPPEGAEEGKDVGDDQDGKIEILPDTGLQAEKAAKSRTTTRYMTKYERARILGTRALQLSMNAPPTVEVGALTDPLDIAMKELQAKKVPIIVRRYLPDRSYEDWKVSELIIDPSL
mmetsp:Transcript_22937/g.54340  ORF Transcript_22937/g.54340 Transcript_22937/m.54340 type:complete len:139 (+) Transcript_22937:172-588(+)